MSLSLADVNLLLTKSEGRDKVARTCQYGARALVGLAALAAPKTGSTLSVVEKHARTIMAQLAGARRTHRWCKEIPVIQSIPGSLRIENPVDRILDLLQKFSLATFMIIDHVGMLKNWNIVSGKKRSGAATIQLGLKFFCFSNLIAAIINIKKASALKQKEGKAAECQKCKQNIFKHALLVLQTLHLSQTYVTHDALVGVAGMISSMMDVSSQLPDRKALK